MKNNIIIGLIITTGVLFLAAVTTKSNVPFASIAFILGMSAVMTKLLVKEERVPVKQEKQNGN